MPTAKSPAKKKSPRKPHVSRRARNEIRQTINFVYVVTPRAVERDFQSACENVLRPNYDLLMMVRMLEGEVPAIQPIDDKWAGKRAQDMVSVLSATTIAKGKPPVGFLLGSPSKPKMSLRDVVDVFERVKHLHQDGGNMRWLCNDLFVVQDGPRTIAMLVFVEK